MSRPGKVENVGNGVTDRVAAQRARFEAKKKRGGGMSDFNKKLEVDLPLLKEVFPGMVFRWVVDRKGRLTTMYNSGWDFVPQHERLMIGDASTDGNTDLGDRISVIAGADRDKAEGGVRQYLMMIPDDIHAEIRQAKQKINNEIDDAILRNKRGEGDGYVENAYEPTSKAKYRT